MLCKLRRQVKDLDALALLNCFILSLLIALTATAKADQEERVFSEYLHYLMQQEGYNLADAIKEIQFLQQGKEDIIQSYIKTEQELQNLEKSAFSTIYFSKLNSVITFLEVIYRKVWLQQFDFYSAIVPLKT
jgi:hypothetical protein